MTDYDYLNARVKAMKAALLGADRLRQLARLDALPVFIETLAATTPYGAELRRPGFSAGDARACERALVQQMAQVVRRLWRGAGEGARGWLEIWLAPWDLANIKLVVRGWQARLTPAEISAAWVPAGTLSPSALNELASAGTPAALAERLAGCGGVLAAVARAMIDRQGGSSLRVLEDGLDQAWARYAAARVEEGGDDAEAFAHFFAWEVDARNLMTALRLARDGGADEGPFLEGGRRFPHDLWVRVAGSETLEQALAELAGTELFDAVRSETPPYEPERALDRIELDVRRLILERCGRLYRGGDPLGVVVPLRFVQLKAAEVNDLRLIAYGLERRLPARLIEGALSGA